MQCECGSVLSLQLKLKQITVKPTKPENTITLNTVYRTPETVARRNGKQSV